MHRILRYVHWQEGLLLLAALTLLNTLARPLGDPALIAGRGQRYLNLSVDAASSWLLWPLHPTAMAKHIGLALMLLAGSGWLVLLLSRQRLPMVPKLMLGVVTWLATIAGLLWLRDPQSLRFEQMLDPRDGSAFWFALSALVLVLVPLVARMQQSSWLPEQQPMRVWLYPTWVLLTGLGQLWLLDFSARAHVQNQLLQVKQFQMLVLCYVVLTLGAIAKPVLAPWLSRLLARLDAARVPTTQHAQPWVLYALYALWVGAVILIVGLDVKQAGLRAELIRFPAIALVGWLAYRWIDADHAPAQARQRGYLAIVVATACAMFPLAMTGDNGQVLLLLLVGAVLISGLVSAVVKHVKLSGLVGIVVFALLASSVMAVVYRYGPAFSQSLSLRIQTMVSEFVGRQDFLAVLRWFMGNTPNGGWGLGQVPWCGTLGSLQMEGCPGIAKQAQSDYVFPILVGAFGEISALAITALTAVWLLGLVRPDSLTGARSALHVDADRFCAWMVLIFSAVSLIQLFVTCFGSISLLPLTGVPYPLVGFGRASLLVCAMYASLAMNRAREVT